MRVAAAAISLLAAAACTSYDPQLGVAPFTCTDTETSCPEGYACVDDGKGAKACLFGGVPGTGSNNCTDRNEMTGNDTLATATLSPVAGTQNKIVYAAAVCPAADKDVYQVVVTLNGQNLKVDLTYDGSAALAFQILNSGGTAIATGTPMGTGHVAFTAANLAIGSSPYYVQVTAAPGVTNGYQLTLEMTGP